MSTILKIYQGYVMLESVMIHAIQLSKTPIQLFKQTIVTSDHNRKSKRLLMSARLGRQQMHFLMRQQYEFLQHYIMLKLTAIIWWKKQKLVK